MSGTTIQIISSAFILFSIGYYILKLVKYRDDHVGQQILGTASQITFSAFIFGFGVLIILLNLNQIARRDFVQMILYYAAFVCLVNMGSIWYYARKFKEKKPDVDSAD